MSRLTGATLCIFILLIVSAGIAQAESIGNWDIFEINFTTTNTYSNPYIDVWLYATFNGPTETIKIDGFWDGDSNWKIRMAPTEAGTWNYITSSNNPQLNGRTGSFTVTESGKKGFVRVNPAYPRSFVYDDGTPFFFLGDTAWRFMNKSYLPFDGTFQSWVDVRESQGFTVLQTNLEMFQPVSEGGAAFPNGDTTRINPSYFQWLDKRMEYATVQKGMVVQFNLMWAQGWPNFKLDGYKNYAKYILARYSAYNIFISVLGEYEEANDVSGIRYAGKYIQTINPYNHPLTTHTTNTTADDFNTDSWISYHGQQQKALTPAQYNSNIIRDRVYGKPVVQMEVCYETQIGEYGCTDPDEYRKAGWSSVIGGGFYVYGHNNIIDDAPKDWNNLYNQGAKEMGYISTFWDGIEYWKMSPNNSLVTSGYALANSGKEYVIYLPAGGSATVDLSAAVGTLHVEWYNPRTGTYQDKTTIQGGAPRNFTAPDTNDWVLHINSIYSTPFQYLLWKFDRILNPLKKFIY